jgi:CDP-glucose 4,6-dehydratase
VDGRRGTVEGVDVSTSGWRDRPVLVTGATGLLGSRLTRQLADAGAEIVCAVRDWVPQSELVRAGTIERVRVARGDVRDQAFLERVLGEYEIHTVFHLAAQTVVGVANRNPISTFETNIGGTWSLLEACRRSPAVRAVVVASSDKAYGDHAGVAYDEDAPLAGRHPYDVSKSCADLIAQAYATTFGLPVAVTRCGNLYGPGDLNWNRLIPGTIRSVLRGERPIIRSDGSLVRDYFYVDDGAGAYLLLGERLGAEPEALQGQAFNFSNEQRISVLELTARILRAMGSDLQPVVLAEARNEIPQQSLSAAKARRRLGWAPAFDLDQGLARTIAWYREFLDVD